MITHRLFRAALVAAPFLAAGAASAGETAEYAAKFRGEFVKQEARPLDDKGHLVIAGVAQGTTKSTGKTEWMDGAQVVWSETVEIANGNGPQTGVITMIKDGVSATATYAGTLKTVMADGRPMTTSSGTWTYVSGSGVEGKGHGTYALTMTSQTTFEGEWKSEGPASFAKTGTN